MAKRSRSKAKKGHDPEKVAAKKARREERKAREAIARARAQRRRRTRQALVGGGIVVVAGVVAVFLFQSLFPGELEGVESPASLGRGHVPQGETVGYDHAAPTSGPHYAQSPRCGVFTSELEAEFAVHALEHGAVVVWYRTDLEAELAPALRDMVRRFDDRVILSPNEGISDPVVVTAWNRRKAYSSADPEILEFIEVYRGRGPERVPCPA